MQETKEGDTVKCPHCGSEDFNHTIKLVHGVKIKQGAIEDEFLGHSEWKDVDSDTYCGECGEEFNGDVNLQ